MKVDARTAALAGVALTPMLAALTALPSLGLAAEAALGAPVRSERQDPGQVILIPPGAPTTTRSPDIVQNRPASPSDLTVRPGRVEVLLPLKERTFYLGDIAAGVTADGFVDLPTERVITLLGELISGATGDALRAKGPVVSLEDLRAQGIEANYDSALLEIVLVAPTADRATRAIELYEDAPSRAGAVERPATPSAWLTWRTAFDYVHQGSSEGFVDPAFDFTGAIRWPGGVVLEGEAFLDTGAQGRAFTRQGTRFVYDQPSQVRRWELGDLRPDARGFQSAPDMAGLSLLKSYSLLQPGRNIRPRGQGAFTLSQPGNVDVFVNGRLVRRLSLDAGAYDVRNFPFTAGQNNVQFVVEDRTGRRELFSYDRFFDQTLLEPGLSEYQLAVGVSTTRVDGQPEYDGGLGLVTGYFRRGISDEWTVGFNAQGARDGGMVGVESVWGAPFGVIGAQAAASHQDGRDGWVGQLNYQWQSNPTDEQRQMLAVFIQAQSRWFGPLSTSPLNNQAVENRTKAEASLSYSREIGRETVVTGDLGYVWSRDGQFDGGRARVGVSRRLGSASSVSVEAQYNELDFRGKDFGVFVTFSHRIGFGQFLRASHETREERSRLSYQRSARGYGDYSFSGDIDRTPNDTVFNGSAFRAFDRVEAAVAHVTAYDETRDEIRDQRSSLRLAGAVAYADGAIAVGRPIYDSFAIVDRHPSLAAAEVVVEPTQDGYALGRTDWLGPALVSEVPSYSRRSLTVAVENAPAGYDVGAGAFELMAPYKSGYRLTVGSDFAVSLIGSLFDRDDQPVPLMSGKAIFLADPDREPVQLFTNRSGRFVAQGLAPGRWRIELGDQPLFYEFEVPAGNNMLRMNEPLRPVRSNP